MGVGNAVEEKFGCGGLGGSSSSSNGGNQTVLPALATLVVTSLNSKATIYWQILQCFLIR